MTLMHGMLTASWASIRYLRFLAEVRIALEKAGAVVDEA